MRERDDGTRFAFAPPEGIPARCHDGIGWLLGSAELPCLKPEGRRLVAGGRRRVYNPSPGRVPGGVLFAFNGDGLIVWHDGLISNNGPPPSDRAVPTAWDPCDPRAIGPGGW